MNSRNDPHFGGVLREMISNGSMKSVKCSHLDLVQDVLPSAEGCEDCIRIGEPWVHLRMCLICGHVGCCDDSINKHATAHFRETGHPLIQSFEVDEDWIWCYVDEVVMTPPPT